VNNARAAGIAGIFAAGNSGSACGTISNEPAVHDAAITIGALADTTNTNLAAFSSRGPVPGIGRPKPDLT